jgi:Spy/CpxP family protein refolding chaperone
MTRNIVAIVTLTALVGLAAATASAQVQEPPLIARAGLPGIIMGLADLTDAQKAAIKTAIETHRPEMLAARESSDVTAVWTARRALLRDIVNVLTPAQRDTVKAQVRKNLSGL